MEPKPLMIDTPGALRALVKRAEQSESIALDTEFVWETGIKHDASNSRPEFSKVLREMNARVRADMAAGK